MVHNNSHSQNRMEAKLEELYGAISPDPGFVSRLRAKIAEKAAEMVSSHASHSKGLRLHFQNTGRLLLGAAALILLVTVLIFSIGLLPEPPISLGSDKTTDLPVTSTSTIPPTSSPAVSTPTPPSATSIPGEVRQILSPDGQWMAALNHEAGSLEIVDPQGVKHTVFPADSTVSDASWSLDSQQLAVVRSIDPQSADQTASAEIWLVTVTDTGLSGPRLVLQPGSSDEFAGAWITLGAWSPDGSRLLFWPGPLSASVQADGLPLWSLEVEVGQATRLSEATLLNPGYQSWSPDGSALVFTDGGYRSAQVGKQLSIYDVASEQITTLISEDVLVPGQVSWSPAGDTIAFAAVEASQTGEEWADWMGWDNQAILTRRIYLLDPQNGEYRRLNQVETYQDAPRWSADGKTLYYVQIDGDQALLMGADLATGEAQPLPGCQMSLPPEAGYYGQVDWGELITDCLMTSIG